MKLVELQEAKYQESKEKTLDGWFIAGNNNAPITVTISDCRDTDQFADSICRLVDWSSTGTLVYHYRDQLEPGTEILFGESETTLGVPERSWYIMPPASSSWGWFIRGPNLPQQPNNLTDVYMNMNEAKYHGVDDMVECPRCDGKGWEWVVIGADDVEKDICPMCDTKGVVRQEVVNRLMKRREEAKRTYS